MYKIFRKRKTRNERLRNISDDRNKKIRTIEKGSRRECCL